MNSIELNRVFHMVWNTLSPGLGELMEEFMLLMEARRRIAEGLERNFHEDG